MPPTRTTRSIDVMQGLGGVTYASAAAHASAASRAHAAFLPLPAPPMLVATGALNDPPTQSHSITYCP